MFEKYDRIFALGCSYTNYFYPTWPSILSTEFNKPVYNLGMSGASNPFITSQLMQLSHYYDLTENDVVIICWSLHGRVSKLGMEYWDTDNQWYHTGGFVNLDVVWNHVKMVPLTYRTNLLNSLIAVKSALLLQNTLPCKFYNFQMADVIDEATATIHCYTPEEEIYSAFADIQPHMDQPSVLKIMYPGFEHYGAVDDVYPEHFKPYLQDWYSKFRKRAILQKAIHLPTYHDSHPLPTEYIKIVEEWFDISISEETMAAAKRDEKMYFSNPGQNFDQKVNVQNIKAVARENLRSNLRQHNLSTPNRNVYELEKNHYSVTLPRSQNK